MKCPKCGIKFTLARGACPNCNTKVVPKGLKPSVSTTKRRTTTRIVPTPPPAPPMYDQDAPPMYDQEKVPSASTQGTLTEGVGSAPSATDLAPGASGTAW